MTDGGGVKWGWIGWISGALRRAKSELRWEDERNDSSKAISDTDLIDEAVEELKMEVSLKRNDAWV